MVVLVLVETGFASDREEIDDASYARINAALVQHHVIPRYKQLAVATDRLATGTGDYCADRGQTDLASLREQFQDAMDAWMHIQHLRFGPIELFMRAHRFYFWPQARGKVSDALGVLMKASSESEFSVSQVNEASVAVQGLLAVETLLYDSRYFSESGEPGSAKCKVLTAITDNMRDMAVETLDGWRSGETPFIRVMAGPGPLNVYFQDHQEVTLAFIKSLHDSLQFIAEVKLGPVAGDTVQTTRLHLVESRLSGRSLRNIIVNLGALQVLYRGEEGRPGLSNLTRVADEKLDQLLRKAFHQTLMTARSIEQPLEMAATDTQLHGQLAKLVLQVRALRQIVRDRLAPALGLSIGFNALDGD